MQYRRLEEKHKKLENDNENEVRQRNFISSRDESHLRHELEELSRRLEREDTERAIFESRAMQSARPSRNLMQQRQGETTMPPALYNWLKSAMDLTLFKNLLKTSSNLKV